MTADRIPEDVRKLAAGAANDLHPFVEPSDRTVGVIARAIMADRAACEAQGAASSTEAVIGNLMALIINVEGWVASGQSETAVKAIQAARDDGWAAMGWKVHGLAKARTFPESN